MALYIVSAICLVILIYIIVVYNHIMKLKARVDEAWSGMDVQLKKRYDLVPQLIAIVNSFAESEKNILVNVAELRSKAIASNSVETQANIDKSITPELQQIMVTVENYPTIKSSANFIKLQNQFVEIEEAISYARKYYNGTVRNMNVALGVFPNSVLAKVLRLTPARYFDAESAAHTDQKTIL